MNHVKVDCNGRGPDHTTPTPMMKRQGALQTLRRDYTFVFFKRPPFCRSFCCDTDILGAEPQQQVLPQVWAPLPLLYSPGCLNGPQLAAVQHVLLLLTVGASLHVV
eukprot:GHRQ01024893.1.p2 GENE.GHRQ01024893.1~~GHRQ01024893.1.p2  ORF type:complete len:106 (-),score=18.82 GHRQ01024893.1:210-527(-)